MTSALLFLRLRRGAAWAFTGRALLIMLTLLTHTVLARLLAPDALGAYFLLLSVAAVLAIAAQLGLGQAIVKLVAQAMALRRPAQAGAAIRLATGILVFASVSTALLYWPGPGSRLVGNILKSPEAHTTGMLVAIWIALLTFQAYVAELYRAFHDIRGATLAAGVLAAGLTLIGLLALRRAAETSSLHAVLVVSIGCGGASVILTAIPLVARIRRIAQEQRRPKRDLVHLALPAWFAALTLLLARQVDLWILSAVKGSEGLAAYGLVVRLADFVALPLIIVNAVLPPIIVELSTRVRNTELDAVLRVASFAALIPALVIGLALLTAGELVLTVLFGTEYGSAAVLVNAIVLGNLVNVWTGPCGITLVMTGHQTTYMLVVVGTTAAAIVAYLLVVETHGAVGVAYVTGCAVAAQNLAALLAARWRTGFWTFANPWRLREAMRAVREADIA